MSLQDGALLLASLSVAVVGAISPTRGPLGVLYTAIVIGAGVMTPFFVSGGPIERTVVGLTSWLGILRRVDFVFLDNVPARPAHRIWFAVSPFDVRRVTRVPLGTGAGRFLWVAVFYVGLVALAIGVARQVRGETYASRIVVFACGALWMYAAVDAVVALLRGLYALFGFAVPCFHDSPYRSRTLDEFWSRRWNQTVHQWLSTHCFRPLARRGFVALGLASAFAVSAFLHFALALPTLPVAECAMIGSFFLVQGALVFVERKLKVARWSARASRTWTWSVLLLSSPLFTYPATRVLLGT